MYPPQRQLGIQHALKVHEALMAEHFQQLTAKWSSSPSTTKRKVVFLLSDFGCGECTCKLRAECNHPKIVEDITVLKGTWSYEVSSWKAYDLEKRVGRHLLDLAMLGHQVLLEGGQPETRALRDKHKMGNNMSKEVKKQYSFWVVERKKTVRGAKKAAPGNGTPEDSTSVQPAAATPGSSRDAGESSAGPSDVNLATLNEVRLAWPSSDEDSEEGEGENDVATLTQAAADGDLEQVRTLLDQGEEINSADNDGDTPLSMAAMYGHEVVVELLLGRGAEVDCVNNNQETPLLFAASEGYTAVVHLLLKKDAEVDCANSEEDTPLSIAAACGHKAVVKELLVMRAEVDCVNNKQKTPLSLAAMNGHKAVVQLLLAKKAQVNRADMNGD